MTPGNVEKARFQSLEERVFDRAMSAGRNQPLLQRENALFKRLISKDAAKLDTLWTDSAVLQPSFFLPAENCAHVII